MARFARLLAAACLVAFTGLATSVTVQPVNPNELIILRTTTTQDSGILRVLTDAFAKKSGLAVKAVVAGSGKFLVAMMGRTLRSFRSQKMRHAW